MNHEELLEHKNIDNKGTKLSNNILSAILKSQKHFFVYFSKDLEIIKTNATFDNFYKTGKKNALKKGIEIFSQESEIYELLKNKNKLFDKFKNDEYSISLETNPSVDHFISWEIIGIKNEGKFSGEIIAFGCDISKERLEKNAMEEEYFSLASRNLQLKKTQTILREAKEKAEAANLAKSNFLSNMSHDVKTPLAGMISFSELLASQVQPSLRNITSSLSDAGKQLMIFFENCIELSKLENSSIVLQKQNFNLRQLLKELSQLFEPAIVSKNLSLFVDCSEKIPKNLSGNRVALYRILINLIGNAIKFTQNGSIKISAELIEKSESGKIIVGLTVADTGIGIPQDKQNLIFEKFSRLTPSYNGTYEGHGIGLYIVQEFIASMEGEIHLKSQEGKGSQFTIVLPFQESSLDNDNSDESGISLIPLSPQNNEIQSTVEKIISPSAEQPHILLVEDNRMAQTSGKMVLHSLNCRVDIAESGKEAIDFFKPGKYDLIFMDIGLPDIKGYEVSKRLREMEKDTSFHVPILGLSAHASQEDKKLSLEAGMEEMLSKPLLFEQAEKILTRYHVLKSASLDSCSLKAGSDSTLSVVGESGLNVISLEKTAGDLTTLHRTALRMLDFLVKSSQQTRTELELLYVAHDMEGLTHRIHKLHGALCYTNTPDLLEAARVLELHLKEGKYDRLEALYQNFLLAMDALEKVYKMHWATSLSFA